MWLPTATATSDSWPAASWAYTENVLLLSCRCTRRFTWTVSSFRTMKSSSVSGTDSCPGQSVKTTVGKGGKEYQEGGGFWRLPHGNQDLTTAPWLDQGLFQATAEGDLTYFIWPAVWPKMSFRWLPSLVLRRRTTSRFVGQRTKTADTYQHETHGVSQEPGLTQGHSQREKSWRISEGYMSPYKPYASCYAVTHTDHTDNLWLFQLVMFFLNSPCLATLYISSLS